MKEKVRLHRKSFEDLVRHDSKYNTFNNVRKLTLIITSINNLLINYI